MGKIKKNRRRHLKLDVSVQGAEPSVEHVAAIAGPPAADPTAHPQNVQAHPQNVQAIAHPQDRNAESCESCDSLGTGARTLGAIVLADMARARARDDERKARTEAIRRATVEREMDACRELEGNKIGAADVARTMANAYRSAARAIAAMKLVIGGIDGLDGVLHQVAVAAYLEGASWGTHLAIDQLKESIALAKESLL